MEKVIINSELDQAVQILKNGGLVAFPTETVYGLGGNALCDKAVAAIYAAKNRPTFNPLIVHIASIEEAKKYTRWDERAQILAQTFWPGPLTLVLPRAQHCGLSLLLSAGLDSVASRMPAHPVALSLLEACVLPLAAPSANRSGCLSPTLASHVKQEFGDKVKLVLDGGACSVGIESTIIDLTGETAAILRHGKITSKALEKFVKIGQADLSAIKAPGMLKSHYAPESPMRLNAQSLRTGEGLLAFGPPIDGAAICENLSCGQNLEEAAANLFRMLRLLDSKNPSAIAVMPVPMHGIGIAINDRLERAAAPK